MTHRIAKVALTLLCASLVVSCSKKYSSDAPLTPQYSPSVIMGSNNGILYAFNPGTGAKNWELSLPGAIQASPLVYKGRVYVGLGSATGPADTLYKINSKTGKLVSKMTVYGATPFGIKATPIADGKLIYLATTNDSVYAIDTGTGVVEWRQGIDGSSIESSPVIYGDRIYVATLGGTLVALDKLTGATKWTLATATNRSFHSSPAIADSMLYIGSIADSNVYGINLYVSVEGTIRWNFKTGGAVLSSPAAIGGKCIVGCSDYYVYDIDGMSGGQNNRFRTGTDVVSSPIISGDKKTVYIGSTDHLLYALKIGDLALNWYYPTNGSIRSSPLFYHNMIYIGGYDHTFYALDAASGTVKWIKTIEGDMDCSPVVEDFSNVQHNSQISGFTNGTGS